MNSFLYSITAPSHIIHTNLEELQAQNQDANRDIDSEKSRENQITKSKYILLQWGNAGSVAKLENWI